MIETWRPCPDSLINEDRERKWTKDNPCPASTAWLLTWRGRRDGDPVSVRWVIGLTGWGSTRARRLLAMVDAERAVWPGEATANTVSTRLQHGVNTAATHQSTGEPAVSEAPNTPPTRRQHAANTPSRARDPLDDERQTGEEDPCVPAPDGASPAGAGIPDPPPVQQEPQAQPTAPRNGVDYPALWATLCGIRGGKALLLTDARRKTLKGAVAEVGAQGVEQIARWVASSPHQRARFLREGGHDSPDTYLRASHRGEYLDLARGAEADPTTAAADPSDLHPWVPEMGVKFRPDPDDKPMMVRGKALDRRDWYAARKAPLQLVVGGE